MWKICQSVSKYLVASMLFSPTRREGAILQSPCLSVRPFTLSLKMSQLLLEEMILFLIHDFDIVTCTVSPFPGLLHIYFLFTVWLRIFRVFTAFSGNECWDIYKFDTNERVGVFLARRSVQHLVFLSKFQIHVYDCWRLNLSPCLLHWV